MIRKDLKNYYEEMTKPIKETNKNVKCLKRREGKLAMKNKNKDVKAIITK